MFGDDGCVYLIFFSLTEIVCVIDNSNFVDLKLKTETEMSCGGLFSASSR